MPEMTELQRLRRKADMAFSLWNARASLFMKFGRGTRANVDIAYHDYIKAESDYQVMRRERGMIYQANLIQA